MIKKYILLLNAIELLEKIASGRRVPGVLYLDEDTGRITFKAYNRKPYVRKKDRLVKKLPWGWVKESIERVKVFGSFPKAEGTATLMGMMDGHTREAKDALIDRELDLIEFC